VGLSNSSTTGTRAVRWIQENTQDAQTITFDALAGKTYGDAPFTVSATASSGLAVGFASDTPEVCTVAGTDTPSTVQVTLLAAGTCTLTASQAGDDTYAAATPVSQSFTVAKAAQTIAFTSTVLEDARVEGSHAVSATATSGLAVSFSSTTEDVCTVAGSTVSFITAGTCTVAADQAGNNNYEAAPRQTQTITVRPKDTTPPVITPTVTGTLGSNGWYTSDVEVSFAVTDDESDITSQDGCDPTILSSDTAGVTLICSATSAGGTSSESVTLKRDATDPTLAPTVSPDPVLLNGSAAATPNAGDALSGIASESCDAVLTDSVGSKSVACMASDQAGNSASASASYEVLYGFSGFSQPVNNTSPNKAKAGQTIPLKWRLTDAHGAPVATLAGVQLSVASLSCSFGSTPDAVEEYASGDSGLQNLGDGLYQYNWKTSTTYAGLCKTLQLELGEGLYRTAAFEFTK